MGVAYNFLAVEINILNGEFMNAITDNKLSAKLISNQDLHERRLAATPRGVGVMANFFIDRAMNSEVWDVEGKRYIDFAGGIAE